MAGSVNKVILIGNLGADPEIRRTQDGRPIANLRIATSETWRDKATGERREKTEWHRVVIFNEGPARSSSSTSRRARRCISRAHCRPASGRIRTGRTATRPRSCCRVSTRSSPCSTRSAAVATSGPEPGGGDFGSSGPQTRKPVPVGAGGKRGDMDDEIPF